MAWRVQAWCEPWPCVRGVGEGSVCKAQHDGNAAVLEAEHERIHQFLHRPPVARATSATAPVARARMIGLA
jgi:hypothetical protein